MNLNTDYLTVFALVLALEIPLVWYRGVSSKARLSWEPKGLLKIALLVTLANSLTHPLVFFGFMASGKPYLWAVLGGQAFAVCIKCLVYFSTVRAPLANTAAIAFWSSLVSWQIAPVILYWAYN